MNFIILRHRFLLLLIFFGIVSCFVDPGRQRDRFNRASTSPGLDISEAEVDEDDDDDVDNDEVIVTDGEEVEETDDQTTTSVPETLPFGSPHFLHWRVRDIDIHTEGLIDAEKGSSITVLVVDGIPVDSECQKLSKARRFGPDEGVPLDNYSDWIGKIVNAIGVSEVVVIFEPSAFEHMLSCGDRSFFENHKKTYIKALKSFQEKPNVAVFIAANISNIRNVDVVSHFNSTISVSQDSALSAITVLGALLKEWTVFRQITGFIPNTGFPHFEGSDVKNQCGAFKDILDYGSLKCAAHTHQGINVYRAEEIP